MANKHNELRLGYVTQLYYDCCDQAVPKQLDLLADTVRKSLDMAAIYRAMEEYEHG